MSPRAGYAAFMLLAAGVFVLARRCFPAPPGVTALPRPYRLLLAGAGFVGGVFGAKLPFVTGAAEDTSAWLADGKTITTGLIGAYLAVELAKLALGVRVKTGDAFALPLALALAVGRWGCFVNGCCCGTPTDLPWGVDFGDGVRRHPTQVYESAFHLGMTGVLLALVARGAVPGHRLQLYLIAYAVFRFATEFVRPEPPYALGLTYYQWASAVLAAGLAAQWAYEVKSGPPAFSSLPQRGEGPEQGRRGSDDTGPLPARPQPAGRDVGIPDAPRDPVPAFFQLAG